MAEDEIIKRLDRIEKTQERIEQKLFLLMQAKTRRANDWVSEEVALHLLGCSKSTLYRLKNKGEIRYKGIGRKHQYSRKSIEKYNDLMST
jgi:predicted DNA-binding transcriptional regulator AlpA